MKILISNDDGIYAEGIRVLTKALKEEEHEVYVVAPIEEQSGTGHGVTLHMPLRYSEAERDGEFFGYWVSGKPADCVKVACGHLYKDVEFDFVIAGINRGANLGTDVFYSGTFAAASEGVFYNKKAIAISLCDPDNSPYFESAAEFLTGYLDKIQGLEFPSGTLLNINVPNLPMEEIKGYQYTSFSNRKFEDNLVERIDTQGKNYYWLGGKPGEGNNEPDTDSVVVKEGYISITPARMDLYFKDFSETIKNY
ncbi:5'/3'-nucleotidase SurE [uncultured Ilyobacter sp.]|uniref:5'/3'-nucleotidase SurE n=1 Tax=uncultured Ilyobacter sp. TaxID=544433 RepID=UPI0029C06FBD|nr:5'/3'-nucleotidase SurE [uncultured Ilyobacter sp.]